MFTGARYGQNLGRACDEETDVQTEKTLFAMQLSA